MTTSEMRSTVLRLERAYRFNKQQKTYYAERFSVYTRLQRQTGRDCGHLTAFYQKVFNDHFLAMNTAYAELKQFRNLCHDIRQAQGGTNGGEGVGEGPKETETP